MKLTFCGGAKSVTGANYLLEDGEIKILIDCGLSQGSAFSEQRNWDPFSYDPKTIQAAIVTHAHIDHVGRLPQLVKEKFQGVIYSTPPTRDAGQLLLEDAEHILAETAQHMNKPILYTREDVAQLMTKWQGVEYHQPFTIGPFTITLYNAGHILGSSFVLVEHQSGKRIVFSGDLGNSPAPLLGNKEHLPETDYCVIESTYGNRLHERLEARKEILEDTIEDAVRAGGVLMIPAFAMERTQELLFEINQLMEQGRIPKLPIFVDSPLAIKLVDVYKRYSTYLLEPMKFPFAGLKLTLTTEESKAINDVKPPKVVIAGSGMSHGGRIVHHERRYLPDPNSMLLIIGYQASGSLGRKILDGAKTVVMFGETIPVRCRIRQIAGYSAHADQYQLLEWLSSQRQALKKVFIVQGEEEESLALAQKIRDELAVATEIPDVGKSCELE